MLTKIIPERLRDNIKRRISAAKNKDKDDDSSDSIISPSLVQLPPMQIPLHREETPIEDLDLYWPVHPAAHVMRTDRSHDFEFELPETEYGAQPPPVHTIYSPLQSPTARSTFAGTMEFPEFANPGPQPDTLTTFLQRYQMIHRTQGSHHRPQMSMSSVADTIKTVESDTDRYPLSAQDFDVVERGIISVDPMSPVPCRRLSDTVQDINTGTIDKLVHESEEDINSYIALIDRMKSSGWSSPQEIANTEKQLAEVKTKWQLKINGAKRILAGMTRSGYENYRLADRTTRSMESARSQHPINERAPRTSASAGAEAGHLRTHSR